eukprot:scaffold121791_cov22-Tisochrysis_lutea.AAC.1
MLICVLYHLYSTFTPLTWKSPAPGMVTNCDARRPAHRTQPESNSVHKGDAGASALGPAADGSGWVWGAISAASTMRAGRWRRQWGKLGAGRSIKWRRSCMHAHTHMKVWNDAWGSFKRKTHEVLDAWGSAA